MARMHSAAADISAVPKQSPRFKLEDTAGEAILYDTQAHDVVYLDQTATMVWMLVDGARTLGEIVELIAAAYPESREAVARDVPSVLSRLAEAGAIELVASREQ